MFLEFFITSCILKKSSILHNINYSSNYVLLFINVIEYVFVNNKAILCFFLTQITIGIKKISTGFISDFNTILRK